MGDQAVRWALQQTHLSPVAQILLVRICRHVMDQSKVWVWAKTRSALLEECQLTESTAKRYFLELEGVDPESPRSKSKDQSTQLRKTLEQYAAQGKKAVLFRIDRRPRPSEYVVLGPNRSTTTAYLEQACSTGQIELLETGQIELLKPVQHTESELLTGQNGLFYIKNPILNPLSPVIDLDSPAKIPKLKLQEIWHKGIQKIEVQLNKQRCLTWYHPARPCAFHDGVLTVELPSAFFLDTHTTETPARKKALIESLRGEGLPVREITFVVRGQPKAAKATAGSRSP